MAETQESQNNPTEDLSKIKCNICGRNAGEIVFAEKNTRTGWYCGHCKFFVKAIGRERIREKIDD